MDYLLKTFFDKVREMYPEGSHFRALGNPSEEVDAVALPPYRAVFVASALRGYAAGYRLPTLRRFVDDFMCVLAEKMDDPRSGQRLADSRHLLLAPGGLATSGLLNRLSRRYADGMAHLQLACALVQAYEDQRRIGFVSVDPRLDIKMKIDVLVTVGGLSAAVDIGAGSAELLRRRRAVESEMKRRASGSSDAGNSTLAALPRVAVVRSVATMADFHGLPVFRGGEVERVIARVDEALEVDAPRPSYAALARTTMADLGRNAPPIRAAA